ncbi:hypothetical protein GQX74_012354 [Glossina fuscipes]|nr:hypothetical protein GQX74_012354 [Glossina fuscipes]
MPYVSQRQASDSKKLLTWSSLTVAPSAAPSATPQKADSQSPCDSSSAPPQKASSTQPLIDSALSPSSSSSSATSDSSTSSQCQPTSSACTSSTSTTSSPKTYSTPSTEKKSSTDSTKLPEIKLPSREQLEKYIFRATVIVWGTSVYVYSVTSGLFDQYLLKQPVLQQYWALFKQKMDQARQEMRSK